MFNESAPPRVATIVVHYKNLGDTLECLRSISKVNYPNLEVILVNNGSSDFNEVDARQILSTIKIINVYENLGFSGGNNIGIKQGLRDGNEYILLLNNDTVVKDDIVWKLLSGFIDPKIGIVGPVIEYYYQPGKIWFAGGRFNKIIGYSYRNRPLAPFEKDLCVEWINGCALFIRRGVFDKIGFLWEPFFLNSEDIDFCLRANNAQFTCVQIGEILVKHKVSASGGIRGTDYFSSDKAYYFARNHFLLLKRNSTGIFYLTGLISQFLIVLPFWTFFCVRSGNFKVIKDYLRGMRDGLKGKTGKKPNSA